MSSGVERIEIWRDGELVAYREIVRSADAAPVEVVDAGGCAETFEQFYPGTGGES